MNFIKRVRFLLIFLVFSISIFIFSACSMSLTRVTPVGSLGLPNVKDTVDKIIKKDKISIKMDVACDKGVGFSNYKSLISDLESINSIQIDNTSRIQLRIKFPSPISKYRFVSTYVLSVFTLGIFPMLEQTSLTARFDIYDRKEDAVVKTYTYDLRKREYTGWAAPAITAFAVTGSTLGAYQDVNPSGNPTPLVEPLARKFATDLNHDLNDNLFVNIINSKEKITLKGVAIFVTESSSSKKIKESIEGKLARLGIPIINQNPETNKAILQIFASEQSGLYTDTVKPGNLAGIHTIIKIKPEDRGSYDGVIPVSEIIDVESGTILDKIDTIKYFYNSSFSFETAMDDLSLELAGSLKTKKAN